MGPLWGAPAEGPARECFMSLYGSSSALTGQMLLSPQQQQQQQQRQQQQQQRLLRHIPTSGFPGFRSSKGLKKISRRPPSGDLQRLLLQRVAAFTKPVNPKP